MNISTNVSQNISYPNVSQNISYPTLQELNDQAALRFLPVIVFLFTLMLCGIFGNVLVCIVYLRKKDQAFPGLLHPKSGFPGSINMCDRYPGRNR